MEEKEKKSTIRVIGVCVPPKLFELAEVARTKLGMNRSRFYQYAITRLLQELSLLNAKVHEGEGAEKND